MNNGAEVKDVRLIIKIENKNPIELFDLTKSLISLANQFDSFVSRSADSKENKEAKLYVKEIKSGSVILELMEIATVNVIPFIENTNTILEFGKFFKKTIDFFLKGKGDDPKLSPSDYKDMSTVLNPIAKDNGSQFIMNTTVDGNVYVNLPITSMEGNAIQNKLKEEIERINKPEASDGNYERVLLSLYQARTDLKSTTGNKGIIDEINKKPLNIVFENDTLKEEMLHGDINPFMTIYVVDVKLLTVQDKPTAYKVLRMHEYFDKEEDS